MPKGISNSRINKSWFKKGNNLGNVNGFIKGNIPWNKGRKGFFKHSEETKGKISDSSKGRIVSKETREKLSKINRGKENPNWGNHKEHKKYAKHIQIRCKDCNKIFDVTELTLIKYKRKFCSRKCAYNWRKVNNWRPNFKMSEEAKKKMSVAHTGKKLSKEHSRKIGLSNLGSKRTLEQRKNISVGHGGNGVRIFNPYPTKFNKSLKEKIRKRDNYICQQCGMLEQLHIMVIGKVLTTHHIDYNKQHCEETNLITLCNKCNIKANKNRDYWTKLFINKIKEIYNYEVTTY